MPRLTEAQRKHRDDLKSQAAKAAIEADADIVRRASILADQGALYEAAVLMQTASPAVRKKHAAAIKRGLAHPPKQPGATKRPANNDTLVSFRLSRKDMDAFTALLTKAQDHCKKKGRKAPTQSALARLAVTYMLQDAKRAAGPWLKDLAEGA